MSSIRTGLIAVLLATGLWCAAAAFVPLASAQGTASDEGDAIARARAHFLRGRELVDQHEYRAAYEQFQAGYELSERPLFVFNMAECAREGGAAASARRHYVRYLELEPDGSMSELAHRRLEELDAPPPEVVPTSRAEPARMAFDVGETAPEPAAGPTVDVTAAPADAARTAEARRMPWQGWWFWTIVGVGLLAVAIATTTGVVVANGNGGPECGAMCADFR